MNSTKPFSLIFRLALVLVLLSQIFASVPARAITVIRYVKWNAAGANNGASWADAYSDLQSALGSVSAGDETDRKVGGD